MYIAESVIQMLWFVSNATMHYKAPVYRATASVRKPVYSVVRLYDIVHDLLYVQSVLQDILGRA